MPLRDHFHPPLSDRRRWEGVHATWPAVIVQQLLPFLPEGFYPEPRVRLGVSFEIDIGTLDTRDQPGAGTATQTQTAVAPAPTWTTEVDIDAFDEYPVHVYDDLQTLVAAIEIVSPRNKDCDEALAAFAGKVAALLRRGVCTSIVDVVTERHLNLYAAVLDLFGLTDPPLADPAPFISAATIRKRPRLNRKPLVDTWFFPLAVGQALPSIPLWLEETVHRSVDLEASYEETCRTLRIA
jgi:hypothetical protein